MKKFWIVLCSLIMLPCLLLATGCGESGTPEEPSVPGKFVGGTYKIQTYTVNGESKTEQIGEVMHFEQGVITGLDESEIVNFTYDIDDEGAMTLTYAVTNGNTYTLTGTADSQTVSFEGELAPGHVAATLKYVKDVQLKLGSYVTSYESIGGVEQPKGAPFVYTGTSLKDYKDGLTPVSTMGDRIKMTSSEAGHSFTIYGTITETSIRFEGDIDGRNVVMVLNYTEDVKLKAGSYKITTYTIDGASQEQYIGELNTIGNGHFIDWLGNNVSYKIIGNVIIVDRTSSSQSTLIGTVTPTSVTFTDTNSAGQKLVMTMVYVQE